MKQVGNVWLPDHEQHLVGWWDRIKGDHTRLDYQDGKFKLAMKYVKNFRHAVDVGGHCGLWSMQMVQIFDQVTAFEPVQEHRDCFALNAPDAVLHPVALGEKDGFCSIHTSNGSSGDSWVIPGKEIPVKRLDSFNLQDVDFIKLDCEGFELFALRGGAETLLRCKPCVIVEQKPGRAQKFGLDEKGAVPFLEKRGAKLREVVSGDFILSWNG